MSHFVPIKVQGQYTNQTALVNALEKLEFSVVVENLNVVLPRKENNLYDSAIYRKLNNEFRLTADYYDQRKLEKRLQSLQSVYAKENAKIALETITKAASNTNKGECLIEEKVLSDGTTQISIAWESDIAIANQTIHQY